MALSHIAIQQAATWPPRSNVRVLVVLDRPMLIGLIKLTLKHGLYTIRAAMTATDVANALAGWQPHLAILDMDLDGAQIRALLVAKPVGGMRLPVIALTRRGDLKNKLAAFEAGVDDILTVPFAPEELLARVMALVRRVYSGAVTFTPVIRVGGLELNILKRTARAGTLEVHLTSLEQGLLYLLAANAGCLVTREEILDTLWGWTTWPRVTWWTARFVTCGCACRTIGGSRALLRLCPAGATGSCQRLPLTAPPRRRPEAVKATLLTNIKQYGRLCP
jgi:DNA-binding response OmpR family regulator